MARAAKQTDFHQLKELLQRDQRSELAELRAMVAEVEAKALHQEKFDVSMRDSLTHQLADVIHSLPADRRDRLNNELSALLNDSMDSRIRAYEPALLDKMNRSASGLVRTGIAQALAEFVQTLQEQINQQLSFKERAKSQVTAMRSGTTESDIVLQRALEGKPKSALLIHRPTGLLIAAADRDGAGNFGDQEALKGSLITAIISFADEAMGDDAGGGLDTLSFGGRTLVLAAQPLTVLAVEYDGVPPVGVSSWLAEQLANMSHKHGASLDEFVGDQDAAALEPIGEDLYALLHVSGQDVSPQFPVKDFRAAPPPSWSAELQNALPMMALFFVLIGGGFFITKSLRAWYMQGRGEFLAHEVAQDAAYDVQLRYRPSESQFSALSGFVVGGEAKNAIEQALKDAFPFAQINLDGLIVLSAGGEN